MKPKIGMKIKAVKLKDSRTPSEIGQIYWIHNDVIYCAFKDWKRGHDGNPEHIKLFFGSENLYKSSCWNYLISDFNDKIIPIGLSLKQLTEV